METTIAFRLQLCLGPMGIEMSEAWRTWEAAGGKP